MARKKNNFKQILGLIGIILWVLSAFIFYKTGSIPENIPENIPSDEIENMKEADYVKKYCTGIIEYRLKDKTRVDCLTKEYAIEFDYAKKWAESIGQALYYSKMTDKKPAVAIIMKSKNDEKYIKRIETAEKSIKIFTIKAYEGLTNENELLAL